MQSDIFNEHVRFLRSVSAKVSTNNSGIDPILLARALGASPSEVQPEGLMAVLAALVSDASVVSEALTSVRMRKRADAIYKRLRRSPPRGQTVIDKWIAMGKKTKRGRGVSK